MHFIQSGEVFIWSRLSDQELTDLRNRTIQKERTYDTWLNVTRFIFLYVGIPVFILFAAWAGVEAYIDSYYHIGPIGMAFTVAIEVLLIVVSYAIHIRAGDHNTEFRNIEHESRVVVPRSLLHVFTRYYRGEYPTGDRLGTGRAMEPLNRDFKEAMAWIEMSPDHFDSVLRVISKVATDIDNCKKHEIKGWYWVDYGLYTRLFNVLLPQMVDMSERIVLNKASAPRTSQQIHIGSRLDGIETNLTMDKLRSDVADLQLYVDKFTAAQKVA